MKQEEMQNTREFILEEINMKYSIRTEPTGYDFDVYYILEQAAKELLEIKSSADVWATLLFIARKRKMRPLGNWYLGLDDEIANLFDACGPERK
jgi:hypothetical protein